MAALCDGPDGRGSPVRHWLGAGGVAHVPVRSEIVPQDMADLSKAIGTARRITDTLKSAA